MRKKMLALLLVLTLCVSLLAVPALAYPDTEYDLEEEESNNSFATAQPIRIAKTYTGSVWLNRDADLFLLTLEEPTEIRLSAFVRDDDANPLDLVIFDSQGRILSKAISLGVAVEEGKELYVINPMILEAGDYYIGACVTGKLNGQQDVSARYSFEVNVGVFPCGGYHRAFYGHVTTPATCISEGEKLMTCPCGATEIKALPVDPEAHTWQTEIITPNTCTDDGLARHTCTSCGAELDEILPADHVNIIRQVIQEPTAEDYGIYTKTCADCGELLSEESPINPLAQGFIDVEEGDFFEIPVAWALYKEITNGSDSFHFNPNGECLRAQVVTFLWRAAGCPEPTATENPFVDVKEGDFFHKAVLWAVEKGITNGIDATHFGPNESCNRAQVVTFLYRAMQSPAISTADCPFADVVAGEWYEPAVLWAVENGITSGMSADTFGVDTTCNRAQVVTFLHRTYVN